MPVILPPVPGAVKIQQVYDLNGYGAFTVHHLGYTGGPPETADVLGMCFDMHFAANTWLKPMLFTACKFTRWIGTDLSSSSGATAEDSEDVFGTRGGDHQVPSQVAMVSSYPISLRYRGGRPRTFWPFGVSNDQLDASNWTTTAIANAAAAVNPWMDYWPGRVYGSTEITGLIAVSYFSGHVLRPTPLKLALGHPNWPQRMASQRRRRDEPVH